MASRSVVIEMREEGMGKRLGPQVTPGSASRRTSIPKKPGQIAMWHVLLDDASFTGVRDQIEAIIAIEAAGEAE